jgi:hypothetical protein
MSATRPPAFEDKFSTPIEASRRGAHRARPKPASAGLPVAAGAAVILLVLGGSYVMLRGNGEVSDSGSNVAAASPGADAPKPSASGGAAGAPTTAPDDDDAAAEPDDDTPADDTPSKPAAARVNRDIRFKLLNSTGVAGLAKRVKATIETDGWQVADADTGNSRNRGLAVTKIYYGRPGTRATALALKKDLGFGTVVRDANALTASDLTTSDLAVVLGTDAQ